ncbi:Enterobactin exporter EntS [Pseudomonas sp. Teo4]|nr:MFS transporter [Pseudomonas sp. Teo4]MDZ3992397.1 Enterobactin exporter EntS [Pseudomonas sp. Teo4]
MPASSRWPHYLRALRHPNFRLYFIGHAVSTLGTWIQMVALSWLIYRLTDSTALLGATTCASLLPQLLVGPFAGAWMDRHDKRKLLLLTQALLGVQASVLALLTYSGDISANLIVILAFTLGVLNAADTPLRQSLLSRFVDNAEDLPNALALNATLFTCSRFVGPPLAGLLIGLVGEAACFALNAISYLALIVGLLFVRLSAGERARGSMSSLFRQGLAYTFKTPSVRSLMFGVLVVNVSASSYAVLLPVFARDVFSGDARTLGWLWGAAGLGSLVSTLLIARQTVEQLQRMIMQGATVSAVALMVFAVSDYLPLSLVAMAVLGYGVTINNVGTNILLQNQAPEILRGRVVSIYTSTRFGFDAIGGAMAGLLAASIGGIWTMSLCGGLLLVYCTGRVLVKWVARFQSVRPDDVQAS